MIFFWKENGGDVYILIDYDDDDDAERERERVEGESNKRNWKIRRPKCRNFLVIIDNLSETLYEASSFIIIPFLYIFSFVSQAMLASNFCAENIQFHLEFYNLFYKICEHVNIFIKIMQNVYTEISN